MGRFLLPTIFFIIVSVTSFIAGNFYFKYHNTVAVSANNTAGSVSPVNVSTTVPKYIPELKSDSGICDQFFKLTCKKREILHDPTGSVEPDVKGQLDALRIYESIIHKHPDWTSEQVQENLVHTIYKPARVKKLKLTFQWVQEEIVKFFARQPDTIISPETKSKLIEQVKKTKLQLPPPATVYSDEYDLYTKSDVYYEQTVSGAKRMRVGGAYLLSARSWFNRVFTFAHELAHSIDPCEIRINKVDVPAYDRLEQCFVKAELINPNINGGKCGDHDQFPEAFADWVASHIVAEALVREVEKFKSIQDRQMAAINAVKDICDQGEAWLELETKLHPSPQIRIEKIFGANPEILRFLDCKIPEGKKDYCEFEKGI